MFPEAKLEMPRRTASDELRMLIREIVREEMRGPRAVEPQHSPEAELLTYAEAAALVRCSVAQVQRWVRSGVLQRRGGPRSVLLRREDVVRAAEAQHSNKRVMEFDVQERAEAILRGR